MTSGLDGVTAKSARRFVWLLFLLLLCAVIDRSNIGYAALTMNRRLGLSAEMFGFGGAMFLIGYVLFDVPSNMLMDRYGARIWLTRIAMSWGLVTSLMAFAHGPHSFYLLRFLVGAAEAGCLPGIIYFVTKWFPQAYRGRTIASVTLAVPVALAIAPPAAAALTSLDGWISLMGWQWLFLVEGAVTFMLGIVCWFHLDDGPAYASWLTPAEKAIIATALVDEHARQNRVRQYSVKQALVDPRILALSLAYGCIVAQMNFSSLWLPQIFASHGVQHWTVAVLTGIPFLCASLLSLICGRQSDRSGDSYPYLLVAVATAVIGWLASAFVDTPFFMVIGFSIAVSGVFTSMALFWTLPPRMLNGPSAAAAIGLISAVGAVVAAVVMPLAGRYSVQAGWSVVLVGVAALSLFALVVLLIMRKPAGFGRSTPDNAVAQEDSRTMSSDIGASARIGALET